MENEKERAMEHPASGFRRVKKGTVMEEIIQESVQGSQKNGEVYESDIMYQVCLPEGS